MTVCLLDKEKGETIDFDDVKRVVTTTVIRKAACTCRPDFDVAVFSVYFEDGKRLVFSQSAYELVAVFN